MKMNWKGNEMKVKMKLKWKWMTIKCTENGSEHEMKMSMKWKFNRNEMFTSSISALVHRSSSIYYHSYFSFNYYYGVWSFRCCCLVITLLCRSSFRFHLEWFWELDGPNKCKNLARRCPKWIKMNSKWITTFRPKINAAGLILPILEPKSIKNQCKNQYHDRCRKKCWIVCRNDSQFMNESCKINAKPEHVLQKRFFWKTCV